MKKLPTKLYNIYTKKVEENTKENVKYAILSYAWGMTKGSTEMMKKNFPYWNDNLTTWGNKSLKKAIETCNYLGIKYIWMDQLCINQSDTKKGVEERNKEVSKMGQYYNNASITLIAIQANLTEESNYIFDPQQILEKIVRSEWFTRSWTYQEGFLSRHTLFMFDDRLIDGREIAKQWVIDQPPLANVKYRNENEVREKIRKFATPLGWVYYKDGYNLEDKIELRLHEVLQAVKDRSRSISLDGVYSILGLLPYGEKVLVNYSKDNTLEQALLDVMKEAVRNGYGEPLAWFGSSYELPEKCWLPKIDSNGSIRVEGGININYSLKNADFIGSNGSLKVNGSEYKIKIFDNNVIKQSSSFSVDSVSKKVQIKVSKIEIILLGIQETFNELNKYEKKDIRLLVPNKEEWKSDKSFALLVQREGDARRRIGLVEIYQGVEKLEVVNEDEIIIGRRWEEESSESRTKRQLSIDSQNKNNQGESKTAKLNELKPMEIDYVPNKDWRNINTNFTDKLIAQWQNLNFTYPQTQDWINIGLQPTDYKFCAWLRDQLKLEPLEVLNNMNAEDNYQEADLKEQFQEYQAQIEQPPK